MGQNSGYLVQTKLGKQGRTFHSKGLIKGKIAVYLQQCTNCNGQGEHSPECTKTVFDSHSERAMLCEISTLKQIGFID